MVPFPNLSDGPVMISFQGCRSMTTTKAGSVLLLLCINSPLITSSGRNCRSLEAKAIISRKESLLKSKHRT